MDPEVWKHLPDHEEILRLILCRVSWDTNLRLRSVSKAFYSMLSEPSVFTWSSMLTDTSFCTDHPSLKWVDGDIDARHMEPSYADTVCLLSTLIGAETADEDGVCLCSTEQADEDRVCVCSTFQSVTYAVVNFELHRWCKLPTLGDLPFGNLNDFTVTGVAEGLLLLERTMRNGDNSLGDMSVSSLLHERDILFNGLERTMSEGGHGDNSLVDMYELDRFLFNPLTKGFSKLPVVPKIKGSSGLVRMIMAVENELVTVVGVEFYAQLQSKLPRILIWRQGSEDWELFKAFDPPSTILPVDDTLFVEGPVTNAVFVGGELFLHVETQEDADLRAMSDGEKVFSFGGGACAIDPELIWSSMNGFRPNNVLEVGTHLFQHKGVLKRLALELTMSESPGDEEFMFCRMNLFTFDCWSRSWQEREIIEFPRHVQQSIFTSSKVVGVLGDILCIRNQHVQEPGVFILYNFLTKQWCRCYAKELADYVDFDDRFFLWSPKRYDSRQITPSVW